MQIYLYIGDYHNSWVGNPVLNQPVFEVTTCPAPEIEKTLTQWKDFLPDPRDKGHFKTPNKMLGALGKAQ